MSGFFGQVERKEQLLAFCAEPRTRAELQRFTGITHREYFRNTILKPLLQAEKLNMTLPEKPNSRNPKYVRAQRGENKVG